jgi:hypothetical protein
MTLSERNIFFKAGIILCAVMALLMTAVSFFLIPVYPSMTASNNYYAVHASLIMIVLFSLAGMILIFIFFERTSAPEILYISFFAVSMSFEIIRLVLPLHFIQEFPSFYLLCAWKVLLFARYFGIFSLFTAGICAAGLEVQTTRNIILFLTISVLAVTLGVPIDTQDWNASLNMVTGYSSIFKLIEAVAFIVTAVSFVVAVKVRGSKEYAYVGIGVVIALTGRGILLGSENWVSPIIGILLLSFGTWFICSKLHKIHLWL